MSKPKAQLYTGKIMDDEFTYSILIRPYTLNCRPAEFKAEVCVADRMGTLIDYFEHDGDNDWALKNACLKIIVTKQSALREVA